MHTPTRTLSPCDSDTYSLMSQSTTTMTIGDSLPAQLVRKSARKGFSFNVMSVGSPGLNKTALLSALFGKDLKGSRGGIGGDSLTKDPLNKPVYVDSKTYDIDERRVRLRLTLVRSKNYGQSLCLKDTHLPLVNYLDQQFADYHKRESSFDRRNITDKMIHCLFFFISPFRHNLSLLDIEFLKEAHSRVNVIPIIAKAEALTLTERIEFKQRVKDQLEKNGISVYHIPDPEPDDAEELKHVIREIQDAVPFAITSMPQNSDDDTSSSGQSSVDWPNIDAYDKTHSDFVLLRTMLNMQMAELSDATHDIFYEEYRLRKVQQEKAIPSKANLRPAVPIKSRDVIGPFNLAGSPRNR